MSGSGMARKSLGRQLKALRLKANKTSEDVRHIASRDKLWRMERGKGPYKFSDVQSLGIVYGAAPAEIARLTDLAMKINSEAIYEDYSDVLPSWFATYYELESFASQVFTYEPDVVPGALQIPEYAGAIFRASRPRLSEEVVERLVVSRRQRLRNILDEEPGATLEAIVGEGALLRRVGGQKVLDAQLGFLREFDGDGRVQVRVLTWEHGEHAAMEGAFNLLRFADEEEEDVAFVDNLLGGRYFEKPKQVHSYTTVFAAIRQQSIPLEEYRP